MHSLASILQTHLGATLQPINQIPDCVCVNSTHPVIDFDAVKEQHKVLFGLPNFLKSADCLHLDPSKKLICFMEVKNASAHIVRNWPEIMPLPADKQGCVDAFDAWYFELKSELRAKLADSIHIILSSIAKYNTDTIDLQEVLDRSQVQIKYFAIFCLNSTDSLTYGLASLQNTKKNGICHGLLAGNQSAAFVFTEDRLAQYISAFL